MSAAVGPGGLEGGLLAAHSNVEIVSQVSPGPVAFQFWSGFAGEKLNQDPVAELRAWKLFGLVPIVLLHKPKHGRTVGRDELAQRADDFSKGRWATSSLQPRSMAGGKVPKDAGDEQRRRGAGSSESG